MALACHALLAWPPAQKSALPDIHRMTSFESNSNFNVSLCTAIIQHIGKADAK